MNRLSDFLFAFLGLKNDIPTLFFFSGKCIILPMIKKNNIRLTKTHPLYVKNTSIFQNTSTFCQKHRDFTFDGCGNGSTTTVIHININH